MDERKTKILYRGTLIAILALAFFVRIYQIETLPAGVYPDEAVNGTDALRAIETGNYKLFYENNYGREGLFMNLIAVSIQLLGNTILALKIWSILFGTLTVFGAFLLTKELFKGSWRAGLIASYFTAFSFWAINFSRISFRANMLPLVLVFAFYFLFKGLRTKKYLDFAVSGLIFGFGLHTYIAFRIAPVVLVALLPFIIISKKNFLKNYWQLILTFFLFSLVSAAPMLFDFWQHPEHFSSRTGAISVFSPEINKGHPVKMFLRSFGLSLVKFNFYGDQNWRHNYPPYPILHPTVGIAFLLGLIYVISKFFHLAILRFRHQIRDEKLYIYAFLLLWLFGLMAPEYLTEEGLPHALRAIGTYPVVFIISTIPVLWLLSRFDRINQTIKTSFIILLTIGFVSIGLFETIKYFGFFAYNPNQHGAFNENYKNMALYLNSLPDSVHKYVIANGPGKILDDDLPVSAHSIKYLAYGKVRNLSYLRIGQNKLLEKPMVLIPMNYDQALVEKIKKIYPEARTEKIDLNPGYGSDFTIIVIN